MTLKQIPIGTKFNMLTLIEPVYRENGTTFGKFQCDCGTIKICRLQSVQKGDTKSCGCYSAKCAAERCKSRTKPIDPLVDQFIERKRMNARPRCEEWEDYFVFETWFKSHYFDGASLYRKDPSEPFGPDNAEYLIKEPRRPKTDRKRSPPPKIGEKFGRLTLIEESFLEEKSRRFGKFLCECGNTKILGVAKVKMGHTKSCGCYRSEETIKRTKATKRVKNDILHRRWGNLKKDGVICEEWLTYSVFEEWCLSNGFDESIHCLFRIDQSGKFSPENTRFGSREEILIVSTSQESKDKRKKTVLEKFGYEYATQHPDIKSRILEKRSGKDYFGGTSKEECSVRQFVESFGYSFPSNGSLLGNRQLDMYCPELKLAIEYNGCYFHTESERIHKLYHFDKFVRCAKLGVTLLFVWSDDWTNYREMVERIFMSQLGMCEHPLIHLSNNVVIENGLGLEKFISRKLVRYEDPSFMYYNMSKKIRMKTDGDTNLDTLPKIWNAGYSIYE